MTVCPASTRSTTIRIVVVCLESVGCSPRYRCAVNRHTGSEGHRYFLSCRGPVIRDPGSRLVSCIRFRCSDPFSVGRLHLSCNIMLLSLLNFAKLLGEEIILLHFDLESFSTLSTVVDSSMFITSPQGFALWASLAVVEFAQQLLGDPKAPWDWLLDLRWLASLSHWGGPTPRLLGDHFTGAPWPYPDVVKGLFSDFDRVRSRVNRSCPDNSPIGGGNHVLP